MTKPIIRTATTIQLDVADFLNVANKIPARRLIMILKAVIRAQLYDQWDLTAGLPPFETGDEAFVPANAIENHYWTITRAKNVKITKTRLKKTMGAISRHRREKTRGGTVVPEKE